METAIVTSFSVLTWTQPGGERLETITVNNCVTWENLWVELHSGGNYFHVEALVTQCPIIGKTVARQYQVFRDGDELPQPHTQWVHILSGRNGTKIYHLFERV